jgi:signal transduction histidine kinase
MSPHHLNALVYRHRTALSLALLAVGLYFVLYSWLVLPPMVMVVGWQPDTELRALSRVPAEIDRQGLEPGDRIVAIDGRPVRRGEALFSPPVKPVYIVEIIRGESRMIREIVSDERLFFNVWLVSQAVLALAIWVVGFLTAYFAHLRHSVALYAGLGFQLIAVGIISPGPSQMGAPGGWIIGHVLIVYFPFILLYLAFAPGGQPLSGRSWTALQLVFWGLTLLAGAAVFEILFLFPERSWQSVTGVRTFTVIALAAGIGVIVSLAILAARWLRLPRERYERRQLSILLLFLLLGLAPLFVLVILPVGAFIFVPFPFVYSLFLLVPAGYFFVLHRHGFLQLDLIFSRLITLMVLVLAIVMAYGTGTYLWEAVVGRPISGAGYGGFALLLIAFAMIGQRPAQTYIDLLIYGRDSLSEETIQAARLELSANPEAATIGDILMQARVSFQIERAAVLVKNGRRFEFLVGNAAAFVMAESPICGRTLLRTRDEEKMADLPAWVELSLPIYAGKELLGLLMLSRSASGYFNARQVGTMRRVADVIAFGLLVISLVEMMQTLSRQALYEKQLQRQEIATAIHNEPLHLLTTALMELESGATGGEAEAAKEKLRQVADDLRRIIIGLRPSIMKDSIPWITRHLARQLDEEEEGLTVILHRPIIDSEKPALEQTKIAFCHILTEALHNVSKHAQATKVEISLYYGKEKVVLEVRDNGVGSECFDWSLTELQRARHMGLADMRRWAIIGGGELSITRERPTGSLVKLTLPLTLPETTIASIYQ